MSRDLYNFITYADPMVTAPPGGRNRFIVCVIKRDNNTLIYDHDHQNRLTTYKTAAMNLRDFTIWRGIQSVYGITP